MAVKHATTATGTDNGNGSIHKAEWNANHTIDDGTLAAAKVAFTATDKVLGRSSSGAGNGEEITVTAAGRALLDDAAASNQRTTLGLAIGTDVPALAHDHSGTTNGVKLAQANTHESPDTDSGTSSLHHTIGTGANQAAAGNHSHAGGIPAGTSFPGSPSTNDLYFRTDRALLYFYDGTRWLTVNLYHLPIPPSGEFTLPLSVSHDGWRAAVWNADVDLWLVDFKADTFVASGNTGSAFWTATLRKETIGAAYATSDIVSASTGSGPDTSAQFTKHTVSIGALLGTSHGTLLVNATKTSTPGTFTGAFAVTYRLVG